jgi:hypothetical protein
MRAIVLALGLILAGCAHQNVEDPPVWVRADGQRITGNPALESQIALDETVCQGEMDKANLSGSSYCRGLADCVATGIQRGSAMQSVGKGCMASRGYLFMSRSQSEAYLASHKPAPPPPEPVLKKLKPKKPPAPPAS